MTAPLRILHLTLASDAGGLSHYIIELAAAMKEMGHQITVAGDVGAWQWAFDEAKIPYLKIPLKGGYFAFRNCARTLNEWLRDNPVDILHTHYRRATLLARRLRPIRPVLYTLHLSHISLAGPRRWLSDFGDHTIVASEDARQWMINDARVSPDRLSLIHHGIKADEFAPATEEDRAAARRSLGLTSNELVALYVGRLDWPKNEEWLLDVSRESRSRLPDLKIIFVGEGPHESLLNQRAAEMGIADRIRTVGYQRPLPFYQAADAMLLPSQREGFSLVCAEAMSVGVPVCRTRTSGTSELIIENVTGRSTPIEHDAFIRGAIEFLSDRDALRRMGAAASKQVQKHFRFDEQVRKTIDLYQSLITVPA